MRAEEEEMLCYHQCFLKESMPFIIGIFFLKSFPEKQEISLGDHISVRGLFLLKLSTGGGERAAN